MKRFVGWLSTICAMLVLDSTVQGQAPPAPAVPLTLADAPKSLDTVLVPRPERLEDFVRDEVALQVLGKALFWDMQVGSDGKTSCASCHSHAGADARTHNTLAPAVNRALAPTFRGTNVTLKATDFPFHQFTDPLNSHSPVKRTTSEVVGSAGVVTKNFGGVLKGSAAEIGREAPPGIFVLSNASSRQVTSRNAPTIINAVLFDRLFWDGRASRFFNGVNPMGDQDPNASIFDAPIAKKPGQPVKILLDNAAMASLSTGPVLSDVEMSYKGRTFNDVGYKMLQLRPLALQKVHPTDSVLGSYALSTKGLNITYAELIRKAFQPRWWQGSTGAAGFTQMESNFSLYWGLAIQAYQRLLISNDAPYDRWARGDANALTAVQKKGLLIFMNEGRCIICHGTPAFTVATRQNLITNADEMLDTMAGAATAQFPNANEKLYDTGFNNTAVRPTLEDIGQAGSFSPGKFFSLTLRAKAGQDLTRFAPGIVATPNQPDMVNGSFKVPSLRNVELTGPYMHDGSMRTLEEVVEFYVRGANFFDTNAETVDNDVHGIPELVNDPAGRDALVQFMKSLTDERVRYERAPFDHPELIIPDGHSTVTYGVALDNNVVLPAVGAAGGAKVLSFAEILPAPAAPTKSELVAQLAALLKSPDLASNLALMRDLIARIKAMP